MSIAQQAAELLAWLDKRSVQKQQGATLSRMHVRKLYDALGPICLNGLNGIGGTLTADQHDGLEVLIDMFNIKDNPVKLIEFAKGEYCPLIDGDLEAEPDVYATLLVALRLIAKGNTKTRSYKKSELRKITSGLCDTTITRYTKLAGVSVPGKGVKNHRYTSDEVRKILQAVIAGTQDENVEQSCKAALLELA